MRRATRQRCVMRVGRHTNSCQGRSLRSSALLTHRSRWKRAGASRTPGVAGQACASGRVSPFPFLNILSDRDRPP